MFPTNTTTSGMFRPKINGGRNQHLLPEAHARAKRMLMQAQQEHINANSSVVMQLCEVWKAKRNGPACSCTKESIDATRAEKRDSYLDLQSFLETKEFVPSSVTERCPICFGTGYSGGYDLQGSQSVVLDATNVTTLKEASIAKERPWWIELPTKGSKVSWIVTIPKYVQAIYGVCIKWKTTPKKYKVDLDGGPLTSDTLMANAGKRVALSVTIKDADTPDLGLFGIFLYFVTGTTMVNVDLPNWTKNFSSGLRIWEEVQESLTANFDARINNLTPQDIFILNDEGFIYRIVEIDCNRPLGVTISWNCQANLVRPNQHYYILPSKASLSKYPCEDTTFIV